MKTPANDHAALARDEHARAIILGRLEHTPDLNIVVRERARFVAGVYGRIRGDWASLDEHGAWCVRGPQGALLIDAEVCGNLMPEDQRTIRTLLDLDLIIADSKQYIGLILMRDDGLASVRHLPVAHEDALLVALIEGAL